MPKYQKCDIFITYKNEVCKNSGKERGKEVPKVNVHINRGTVTRCQVTTKQLKNS